MIKFLQETNLEYFKDLLGQLVDPTLETIFMVFLSALFALLLGIPLAVLLSNTSPGGLSPNPTIYSFLSRIINILRSFPFIILMIVVFPISRILVGTSIGTKAAIVPLTIAATPFIARVIESSLKEVPEGAIQAAKIMGATNFQIIFRVIIPESLPSLISGITLSIISLIGYSAMAGAIGAGGLGNLAIVYGYNIYQTDILVAAVLVIIVLVESTQYIGNLLAKHILSKR